MEKKCGTCRYWDWQGMRGMAEADCRRHSPRPYVQFREDMKKKDPLGFEEGDHPHTRPAAGWPSTDMDHWCGDWKKKTKQREE